MENNSAKIVLIIFAIIFLVPLIGTFGPILLTALSAFNLEWYFIPLVILGFLIIWFIVTYNKLVSAEQKVSQAQGMIDVYLKKRFDLIPNLVETVKGYKKYEEELVTKITELRNEYMASNKDDLKQMQDLSNRFTGILAIAEDYPELKASEQFLNLQKNLSKVESELQAARRIYNSEVTEFNTKRLKFPSNIVGGMCGFKIKDLFEIELIEKENVKVDI